MSRRRVRRWALFLVLVGLVALAAWARPWAPTPLKGPEPGGAFVVKPYVQLGDNPRESVPERAEILWQADDRDRAWSVASRPTGGGPWAEAPPPRERRYAVDGLAPRRLYRASLTGLEPGVMFDYRVARDGAFVFEARARARKGPGTPHRFVAFGDGGADTVEQRAVARQAALARPDFVVIAGDLVYYKGRTAEYDAKFFPIYNADALGPDSGAPLLRSTLVMVAPGNHDLMERDLGAFPDALAYYEFWSLPLNGPLDRPGAPNSPTLRGPEARRRAFLDRAGAAYPRMANYSFDYGGCHWTVLDTNAYADWSDPALRAWLERDLAAASGASWRFVTFHQPPFHSSRAHRQEQHTRQLAALFERHKVDLVISGHIHNYQRSHPLKFAAAPGPDGRVVDAEGNVRGSWVLDRTFDGTTHTRPDGILYLVTGAGGARLYNTDQHDNASTWQSYTARFVSNVHSLTIVDVTDVRLDVRQVSEAGVELDRFAVTRSEAVQ